MIITIEVPVFDRLRLDASKAVRKGAERAREIIITRTLAGRAADGSALPKPKSGGKALVRTGETLRSLVVRVRGLRASVRPDGYHSTRTSERAIGNVKKATKKRVSQKTKKKLRRAAARARMKAKGQVMGGGALPLIMYAQQAGSVGGKRGARPQVEVMELGDGERVEVEGVMAEEITRQVDENGIDFRTVRRVLSGAR